MIEERIAIVLDQIRNNLNMDQNTFAKKLGIKIKDLDLKIINKNRNKYCDSIFYILKDLMASSDWFIFEHGAIKSFKKYNDPIKKEVQEIILECIARVLCMISDANLCFQKKDKKNKKLNNKNKNQKKPWAKYMRAAFYLNKGYKQTEVEKLTGFTPETINRWIKKGKLNKFLKRKSDATDKN